MSEKIDPTTPGKTPMCDCPAHGLARLDQHADECLHRIAVERREHDEIVESLQAESDDNFERAKQAEATLTRLLSAEAQKAAEAVLVELVGSNLAFNVAAYGKAWTGEGEDTEFLVGSAVLPALQAAINAVTNQEETNDGE